MALNIIMIVLCRTLFDITKTNVSNRRKTMDIVSSEIIKQRNQQSNYETVIQVISLRALPENISEPKVTKMVDKNVNCWEFQFEVLQNSVFNDGDNELGNLYTDCNGVPMIVGLDESKNLTPILNKDNIYFEIIQK